MLEEKVALVTGAGRGIGRAIALALAAKGALVVVNYNGSEEKAEETAALIETAGGKADIYGCNVADFTACGEMIKTLVSRYGHQRHFFLKHLQAPPMPRVNPHIYPHEQP